jgi:hypothetical protein
MCVFASVTFCWLHPPSESSSEAPVSERWMSTTEAPIRLQNAWHWDDDSRGGLEKAPSLEGTCSQRSEVSGTRPGDRGSERFCHQEIA